jgi:hypothetical protein
MKYIVAGAGILLSLSQFTMAAPTQTLDKRASFLRVGYYQDNFFRGCDKMDASTPSEATVSYIEY